MSFRSTAVAAGVFAATTLMASPAFSAPPSTIRVQGSVSDRSGGTPVPANGMFQMTFRLNDAAIAGTLVASSGPSAVQVTDGLYNVDVAFPPASFNGGSLFLEVQINSETLSPRIPVVSVPYAYLATQSSGVTPGAVGNAGLAPGSVTADKLGIPCAEGETLVRSGGAWVCRPAASGCIPGDFVGCYDDPPSTLNQGPCVAGRRTCPPAGGAFGPCEGEVLPAAEICGNGKDENCDGVIDDPIGQHSNGIGQLYNSCQPLGVPGDSTTYSHDMGVAAGQAANFGNIVDSVLCGSEFVIQEFNSAQHRCAIWRYQGTLAGHVRVDLSGTCTCPVASDPTWN